MTFIYEKIEDFYCWIAWHIPRTMAYWAFARVAAHASAAMPERTPDSISVLDAMDAWFVKGNGK